MWEKPFQIFGETLFAYPHSVIRTSMGCNGATHSLREVTDYQRGHGEIVGGFEIRTTVRFSYMGPCKGQCAHGKQGRCFLINQN